MTESNYSEIISQAAERWIVVSLPGITRGPGSPQTVLQLFHLKRKNCDYKHDPRIQ